MVETRYSGKKVRHITSTVSVNTYICTQLQIRAWRCIQSAYKDHIFINICQRLLHLCDAHSNPRNAHTKLILFNCTPFTSCHCISRYFYATLYFITQRHARALFKLIKTLRSSCRLAKYSASRRLFNSFLKIPWKYNFPIVNDNFSLLLEATFRLHLLPISLYRKFSSSNLAFPFPKNCILAI